mgnify:CR=1 FL=1
MAGACVRVEQRGSTLAAVIYRAPGTRNEMVYVVSNPADARRQADDLVALLAPLVDLGMRHAEARRPAPRPPRSGGPPVAPKPPHWAQA